MEVNQNPDTVIWTNGGYTPNYIKLCGTVNKKTVECWTCENKLRYLK